MQQNDYYQDHPNNQYPQHPSEQYYEDKKSHPGEVRSVAHQRQRTGPAVEQYSPGRSVQYQQSHPVQKAQAASTVHQQQPMAQHHQQQYQPRSMAAQQRPVQQQVHTQRSVPQGHLPVSPQPRQAPAQKQIQYVPPPMNRSIVQPAPTQYAAPVQRIPQPVQHMQPVQHVQPVHHAPVQPVYAQPVAQPVAQRVQPQPVQYVEPEVYEPVEHEQYYEQPYYEDQYVQPVTEQYSEPVYQPVYQEPEQYVAPVETQQPVYQEQAHESFRPPYADQNTRTGYSHVQQPVEEKEIYDPQSLPHYEQLYEDIEPTETDIVDANDMDEGTVQEKYIPPVPEYYHEPAQPKQYTRPQKNLIEKAQIQVSPRMNVAKTYQERPYEQTRQSKEDEEFKRVLDNQVHREEKQDDWKYMQKKIDIEYEKKLKEVSDDALKKLKHFQKEHKQLVEKTQFIHDTSQILSRAGSRQSDRQSQKQETPVARNDRNRFFSPQAKHSQEIRGGERSEATLIRQLHQDFQDILVAGKNMAGEIYLVDVLAKLHFFDDDFARDNSRNLYSFLEKSKQNLLVKSDLEKFRNDQDDIQKNLFKICCAILNLQVNQRGHNFLDEKLLYSYLDSINFHRDDQDLVLIDQLSTIKSLINRKSYSLTDKQIKLIHDKFMNLADQRENYLNEQERLRNMKAYQNEREFYTPQIEKNVDPKNTVRGPHSYTVAKNERQEEQAQYGGLTNKYGFNPDVEQQKIMDQRVLSSQGVREEVDYHSQPHRNTQVVRQERQTLPRQKSNNRRSLSTKRAVQKAPVQPIRQPIAQPRPQPMPQSARPVAHAPVYETYQPPVTHRQPVTHYQPQPQPVYHQQQQQVAQPVHYAPTQQVQQAPPQYVQQQAQPVARAAQPQPQPVRRYVGAAQQMPSAPQTQQVQKMDRSPVRSEVPQTLTDRNREQQIRYSDPRHQLNQTEIGRGPSQYDHNNDASYSFGKAAKPTRQGPLSDGGRPAVHQQREQQSPRRIVPQPKQLVKQDSKEEEPICVLKVELDHGENVQHIKVYPGQLPEEIVDEFGRKFNLSERAKFRLLDQINEQINA